MDSKMIKGKKIYSLTKMECQRLIQAAKEVLQNTYPKPKEGYAVALLTDKGNIYVGVSYGSNTETLTMHSEATALAHAAIHGETKIVAITGPNCHICKQLIWESSLRSGIDTVIVHQEKGEIKQTPISKLMPYPWPAR
ncbi:hypothetical protein CO181_04630 [candidate division WWE3 bacterium CG_4_9_14_3_um_filter_43_9]|uniref:CMP/dCMP-type deaminase domain-containing protein n=1 Tax=candidate division WWE3 bacterium CG_4_9_14_3_um_filter_43_9 TaxID=1975082 RepID=A0A2M7WW12_UNCKA|nr:MAG: hypothetical protein CO181_04630 [candidate division WWE3 bacterium CG_4_9_14_3_um_filter_43_9]